jgi:alcohol dehydrogenase class IV
MAKNYRDVAFLEVKTTPRKEIVRFKHNKDVVIGIGGGSVIDTAKIIARNKRCVAIPTTASGAAMTPYATIWGKKKLSIRTRKPKLRMDFAVSKNLSPSIKQATLLDALSHAIESYWSKNATAQSRNYARRAIRLLCAYIKKGKKNNTTLVHAGNLAGQAIAITKTNVIHALSYPITITYGVSHGLACGMVLPYAVAFMNYRRLPRLFGLNSTEALVRYLMRLHRRVAIKKIDASRIAKTAMQYNRINDGPEKVTRKTIEELLKKIRG